jgi:hypothetical protein
MKAFEKLALYKQRLLKWIEDGRNGHLYREPTPRDFSITQSQELFMARKIREEAEEARE